MAELPSGTVTFLFTDLEGSTRLWEEHPDAMPGALVRHDEILRRAVEGHGGVVFSEMGDGMAAVFASAAGGVAAALDAQVALRDEPWGEVGALRARMGLHAGEGALRADGQYVNAPLNRCARLMAVAHGGQVVISDSVEVLVRDGLGPDVSLADLGAHRLRDLAQPVGVFQVCAAGLPAVFPPLRSVDAFPGNLPRQLTSFVGRDDELAGVSKALDEWRLVTLTGTGGVGKTRLAVQVAADVLPEFRDGAWLCELAVATDDDTMGQVVAAELGLSQRPGMSLGESISDYLRPKQLLLVLDNCEQLLGPVSALADRVLRECPGVRILATSREGLAVGGEHVWPLRSLPLPDVTGAGAAASDAVQLFVERADAARAGFALDSSNVDAVGEICRRLDGIPLAIELAAARTVALSPRDIADLLDERFRLLTGGRRTAVERHQTLRATVDWSYSLLGEQERVVFDRLGVFAGSFDARAAQAIVTGDGVEAWDVLDALTDLVAKSMVVVEETADGSTRYGMLETLRQYARERLDERGDADTWRRRHAEHFAAWAEEAGPGLVGPDEVVWRVREVAELDNLRAAVRWALDRDNPDDVGLALRIIGALASESHWSPVTGVGAWAEPALPHVGSASPQLRYAVTAAAAAHCSNLGEFERAPELALKAIGDGVPPGAPAPEIAHSALAVSAAVRRGGHSRALAIKLDAARFLDRDFPGSASAALAHAVAAMYAHEAGDPIARAEADTALRLARASANPSAIAVALAARGWVQDDEPDAALAALDESIALSQHGAAPTMFGPTLALTAAVRVRTGDLPHAAHDLREGIERAHQGGVRAAFYMAVLWGTEILLAAEDEAEVAVFEGIARSSLSDEYVAAAGWARQRAAIADARASWGPDRYDAAFRIGVAMSYEQAVEHTLAVLEDVITNASGATS